MPLLLPALYLNYYIIIHFRNKIEYWVVMADRTAPLPCLAANVPHLEIERSTVISKNSVCVRERQTKFEFQIPPFLQLTVHWGWGIEWKYFNGNCSSDVLLVRTSCIFNRFLLLWIANQYKHTGRTKAFTVLFGLLYRGEMYIAYFTLLTHCCSLHNS